MRSAAEAGTGPSSRAGTRDAAVAHPAQCKLRRPALAPVGHREMMQRARLTAASRSRHAAARGAPPPRASAAAPSTSPGRRSAPAGTAARERRPCSAARQAVPGLRCTRHLHAVHSAPMNQQGRSAALGRGWAAGRARTNTAANAGNTQTLTAKTWPPVTAPTMDHVAGCGSSMSASRRSATPPCRCRWLYTPEVSAAGGAAGRVALGGRRNAN